MPMGESSIIRGRFYSWMVDLGFPDKREASGDSINQKAPSGFATSPKYDNGKRTIFESIFHVEFGGGRWGRERLNHDL
jgi:hypothetical protein